MIRGPLYEVGLDYRHGTGHGIGAYGLVHESPIQVEHHFISFIVYSLTLFRPEWCKFAQKILND